MKGALITGAGKRIGAGIAKHLGAKGWHVFVHYNSSKAGAEAVAAEIIAQGGAATAIGGNLLDEAATLNLVPACEAICPLGLLINNASTFRYDSAATVTYASMEENLRVNLHAPVFLSQAFHAAVKARGAEGVIINMVDNKVFALNPDYFSYTLGKVAVQGMIQMQAMSFAPAVRVAGIAPGLTLISNRQTEAEFERAHKNNPLQRGVTVEQITGAVDFILSTQSYHGQTLVIDGGQVLRRLPRDIALLHEGPMTA